MVFILPLHFFFISGREGFEPSPSVLETKNATVTPTPYKTRVKLFIFQNAFELYCSLCRYRESNSDLIIGNDTS